MQCHGYVVFRCHKRYGVCIYVMGIVEVLSVALGKQTQLTCIEYNM